MSAESINSGILPAVDWRKLGFSLLLLSIVQGLNRKVFFILLKDDKIIYAKEPFFFVLFFCLFVLESVAGQWE